MYAIIAKINIYGIDTYTKIFGEKISLINKRGLSTKISSV
jgi:hypothetical protein